MCKSSRPGDWLWAKAMDLHRASKSFGGLQGQAISGVLGQKKFSYADSNINFTVFLPKIIYIFYISSTVISELDKKIYSGLIALGFFY